MKTIIIFLILISFTLCDSEKFLGEKQETANTIPSQQTESYGNGINLNRVLYWFDIYKWNPYEVITVSAFSQAITQICVENGLSYPNQQSINTFFGKHKFLKTIQVQANVVQIYVINRDDYVIGIQDILNQPYILDSP